MMVFGGTTMATKKATSAAKKTASAPKTAATKATAPKKAPAVKAAAKKPSAAAKKAAPTREAIAALAHKYWAERGYAHGSHHDDWLRAEKDLS